MEGPRVWLPRSMVVFLGLASLATGQSPPPPRVDLSGTWMPDLNRHRRRTEPRNPDRGAPAVPAAPPGGVLLLPPVRVIDQGPVVVFDFLGEDGRAMTSLRFTTDGAENLNPRGNAPAHVSRSRREGRTLRTEWRLMREAVEALSGVDTWTLSEDGATLTQETVTEGTRLRGWTNTAYKRK